MEPNTPPRRPDNSCETSITTSDAATEEVEDGAGNRSEQEDALSDTELFQQSHGEAGKVVKMGWLGIPLLHLWWRVEAWKPYKGEGQGKSPAYIY